MNPINQTVRGEARRGEARRGEVALLLLRQTAMDSSSSSEFSGEEEDFSTRSHAARRPKFRTFRATCSRFVVLYAVLVMVALCAATFLLYAEVPVGHYQDLDSVTMLFDHRKAERGIRQEHGRFQSEDWNGVVTLAGKQVDFEFVTDDEGEMKTAKYVGELASQVAVEAPPATCPDTSRSATHGVGTISFDAPAFNTSSAYGKAGMVTVTVGAESAGVPLYRVRPAGSEGDDWAAVTASRLTEVVVRVARSAVEGRTLWRIAEVDSAHASASTEAEVASLRVELRDSSEPAMARFPALEREWYAMAALACAAVVGLVVSFLPIILYREYILTLKQNGLPLPFFRYTTQFRGW